MMTDPSPQPSYISFSILAALAFSSPSVCGGVFIRNFTCTTALCLPIGRIIRAKEAMDVRSCEYEARISTTRMFAHFAFTLGARRYMTAMRRSATPPSGKRYRIRTVFLILLRRHIYHKMPENYPLMTCTYARSILSVY